MAVPKILATSVIEMVVESVLLGQQVLNVFHYAPTPVGAAPELDATLVDMMDAVEVWWKDNVLTQLVTDFVTLRIFSRELSGTVLRTHSSDPPVSYKAVVVRQFNFATINNGEGANEGDPIPSFNAANIYLSTLLDGRNSKGGKRIAGLYKSIVEATNGNQLTAAAFAAYKVVAQSMLNQLGLLGDTEFLTPCLFLRTAALSNPDELISLADYRKNFLAATCFQNITSQVSRKVRNRSGQ